MGELRLFKIIGTPLIAVLIVTGMLLFFTDAADRYSVSGLNTTGFKEFNKEASNFKSIGEDFENSSNPEVSGGDDDATFWVQAINSVKTTLASFSLFEDMIDISISQIGFGSNYGNTVKYILAGLVMIVIILGILAYALTRSRI